MRKEYVPCEGVAGVSSLKGGRKALWGDCLLGGGVKGEWE